MQVTYTGVPRLRPRVFSLGTEATLLVKAYVIRIRAEAAPLSRT